MSPWWFLTVFISFSSHNHGGLCSQNRGCKGRNCWHTWLSKAWNSIQVNIQCTHLSGPHLSRLFNYPDTCLGTNPHSSTESDSLIWKFSYLDSQSGNGGVRISEVPLYTHLSSLVPLEGLSFTQHLYRFWNTPVSTPNIWSGKRL